MSLEESLIEHCAPTLAGIKTANLYRFFPEDPRQFALQLKLWREWFAQRGLGLIVLKGCRRNNSYLLYLYRPQALARELERPGVREFLTPLGYDMANGSDGILRQLVLRLCRSAEFPHEIGIFLGYPLEDVVGFIKNRGKNYTCCGCWKSYGNPFEARRRFSSYRACTATYKRQYAKGVGVVQLTVAA